MHDIIMTFQERQADWWQALVEHLQISLLSLLIAVVIAVPLGIVLTRFSRVSEPVLQITGVFQTIPSLALLGLFIPFMGIGTLPAVTALVIYALFPILQNTVTGLRGVDRNLIEAATAFGMTHWERLKKFELALALPVIVSGIRTAAVLIIGTATLAALIGAGGLGTFILLGIDRNNASLILIGAVSSALLAILFNVAIRWLERSSFKRVIISFVAMVVALGVSFAPDMVDGMMGKEIIIAGKLGPEPEILINIYKELIEEQSDIKVVLKPNFGKTSFLYEALKAKQIDLYPEFSGTITSSLLNEPVEVSNEPRIVYETARDAIYQQDKLVYLEPMEFQNTYAVAVKKAFAEQHDLQSIADLQKIESQAIAGFTLEFNDREDGYQGLQKVYGLNLSVKTMEPALRYQAIAADDIQITDAYSTDSELKQFDLVVLTDDRQLFPPYQGAPLLREDTLKRYPELQEILNQLAGKMTAEQMSEMNYQVKVLGRSAQEVAHEYLLQEGLVAE